MGSNLYRNAISQKTKAILSKDSAYFRSVILEGDREYVSYHKPEEILDNSCLIYGSTLAGRRKFIKKIFNIYSKIPIPVIPEKGVFLFPTTSAKKKDCVWLSYYHIEKYKDMNGQTYIHFIDGTGLLVNVSPSTIDMQHKRTSQIIAKMNRSIFFGRP